jgi:chitinase
MVCENRTAQRASALLLLGALMAASAAAQAPKRLVAYYYFDPSKPEPRYSADLIPYQKMTHLIHVIVQPAKSADGTVEAREGALEATLVPKAHAAGVRVLACVQGPAEVFSKIAADETSRKHFGESLREFIDRYGYDGVDIDWEVPKGDVEVANCTKLMQAARAAMPAPRYLLSMATTSTPGHWGEFDFAGLTPVLDFYNVMTYDFHGPWTDHTGHNSPLFSAASDTGNDGSLDNSLGLYLNQFGVPPEKINLGTGFYGYEFPVAGLSAQCQCEKTTKSRNYGTYIKPRVNRDGWTRHLDPVAMAPYLVHDADPAALITYDDPESTMRKVIYALQVRDLGGVFTWELSSDYDGTGQDLLDAMYAAFQRATGKSNPR